MYIINYYRDQAEKAGSRDGRPAWMRTLHTTALDWLKIIPNTLEILRRTADNIKDPLFRFFEREVTSGSKLLQTIRTDLANVVQVCEAKRKQTNYLRSLISDLAKGNTNDIITIVSIVMIIVS